MAIAVIPYGMPDRHFTRLATLPLDRMQVFGVGGESSEVPPVDTPHVRLADLRPDDDALMFTSSRALTANLRGLRCGVSLVLLEPPAIQWRYYKMLRIVAPRYRRVFTYCDRLIARIPNGVRLSHGGATVRFDSYSPDDEKRRDVSLIASAKRTTNGHRMRHQIASWGRDGEINIDLFGRGYFPVDNVAEALVPYRFSVVIENSRYPGYFTEKLIDCLLSRTVPIYCGDPEIGRHFDPRGMIVCSSNEEIRRAITSLDRDAYDSRKPFVEANRQAATWFMRQAHIRAAESIGPLRSASASRTSQLGTPVAA